MRSFAEKSFLTFFNQNFIFRPDYHVMKEMGQLEELSFPDGRHVSVITTLDGLLNGHHRHQNGHPPHNGHHDGPNGIINTTNGNHVIDQSRDHNIENNSTGFDNADGDSGVEQIQNDISRVSPIPNINHQEIKQENYYAESGYTSSINSVCTYKYKSIQLMSIKSPFSSQG